MVEYTNQGDLTNYLTRFARRLRQRDGWIWAQSNLWLAVFIALLIQIIGRFIPITSLRIITTLPFLVWTGTSLYKALFKPISLPRTALQLDSDLNLKERLSTAIALQTRQDSFSPALVKAQFKDALFAARTINSTHSFAYPLLKRPLLVTGVFLLITTVLLALPNPMDVVLEERRAISQAALEQADRLDTLYQEIEAADKLSAEERQDLLRELEALSQALRANSGNLEQALADISKAEDAIRSQLDPTSDQKKANLETLTDDLASLARQPNNQAEGSSKTTSQTLDELLAMSESMGATQRQQTGASLAQMAAQASQAGDIDLAQSLSSLSQAMASGDQTAIRQAVSDVKAATAKTQTDLAGQSAMQGALNQVEASRQAIHSAAQSISQASNQDQTPNESLGQGDSLSGQGENQNQNQPGGGGSQANTLPPASSQGQAGAPQGSVNPESSIDDLNNHIYAPRESSVNGGENLYIPGQDTDQGETQVSEDQNPHPGEADPALVPYQDVYYNYLDGANQAMIQVVVPAGLEAYVREYFSHLEP